MLFAALSAVASLPIHLRRSTASSVRRRAGRKTLLRGERPAATSWINTRRRSGRLLLSAGRGQQRMPEHDQRWTVTIKPRYGQRSSLAGVVTETDEYPELEAIRDAINEAITFPPEAWDQTGVDLQSWTITLRRHRG